MNEADKATIESLEARAKELEAVVKAASNAPEELRRINIALRALKGEPLRRKAAKTSKPVTVAGGKK